MRWVAAGGVIGVTVLWSSGYVLLGGRLGLCYRFGGPKWSSRGLKRGAFGARIGVIVFEKELSLRNVYKG